MQLIDWLKKRGCNQAEMAESLGLSKSRLSRICTGTPPRLCEVMQIEEYTKGRVTAKDFLERMRNTPRPN